MRKFIAAFVCILVAGGGFALADFKTSGKGSAPTSTVEECRKLYDGAWVTLDGSIVQILRKERYLFHDTTGDMQVVIENDQWHGRDVTPTTKVRLHGKIDRDSASVQIRVRELNIMAE